MPQSLARENAGSADRLVDGGGGPLLQAGALGVSAPRHATATANANIALVKYWGKRDAALNLPAVGSISITLDGLRTDTRVSFDPGLSSDQFLLNGRTDAPKTARVAAGLELLRRRSGSTSYAWVESRNHFPTGAGLASSASGFAALMVAGAAALDLDLAPSELSELARRCSGSAARSVFGGFVEWRRGDRADGRDSHALPLMTAEAWPLRVVVAVTSRAEKAVGSTAGMNHSSASSPFQSGWVDGQERDLDLARAAILARDFDTLAEVAEHSCLKMHALAMTARPPVLYWNTATLECLHQVRDLRARGVAAFFTIDAGPQVKVVCEAGAVAQVSARLRQVPGVQELIECGLGAGATVLAREDVRCA